MKKYLFLFVVGILLGLISCKTKTTCPEFDKEILSWIPYQKNDVIELYSQSNDSTIIISIKSVKVIHTTHYTNEYRSKCEGLCFDEIQIRQNDNDHFIFKIDISLFWNKVESQNYQINDTYFTNYSEVKNFPFEDKEYDIVRIFETNNSKVTFKKLIIAKEIGIIGLIDIYDNTWT